MVGVGRPAASYRGARRNAWRGSGQPWVPMRFIPRQSNHVPPDYRPLTGVHRYEPYLCKPHRVKFGWFDPVWPYASSGPIDDDHHSLDAVLVPYTKLRAQPKVYRHASGR